MLQSLWKFRKHWRIFTYIVSALLLILPLSETFSVPIEDEDGIWTTNYVLNSIDYALYIVPIGLMFVAISLLKRSLLKRIIIISLLLITAVVSAITLLSAILPLQDFGLLYGSLLLLILSPMAIISALLEWKDKPSVNTPSSSLPLDYPF